MNEKLRQIFKEINMIHPPRELEGLILQKIALEREKMVQRRLVFVCTGLVLSIGMLILSLYKFGQALWQSEFWSLAKLMFSDAGVVIRHWNEFGYSLLETFPVFYAILILLPIFALLVFLNYFIKYSQKNYHFRLKLI